MSPDAQPPPDTVGRTTPDGDVGGSGDVGERLELALEELEVLSRHLADATVTIERLRTRLAELEALEARSLRGRTRRLVDRLLGIPPPRPLSADLPPAPPSSPPSSAAPGAPPSSAGRGPVGPDVPAR